MFVTLSAVLIITIALLGTTMDDILRRNTQQSVLQETSHDIRLMSKFKSQQELQSYISTQINARIHSQGLDEPWYSPKALRRDPEKLLLYLNKELASAGYIAGERVIFLGRKEPSSFGALIDRYVKDYVICPVCGSPDTRTEKSKKVGFLLCEACGARSSIKGNYA